ncbi:pilus assembly FimT family protein [Ideonella livida]|uniref:Type II secretion system protein H n=1 Tax=Ideonella livida TaxID=2707176 RepID=A0A7C9TKX9_9BURK|nr:GspH/FimT family pseudopilin [Ideonella livida]NDY92084.1 prepilin-type N-terminal cleavage/methylation domain-containing protein [Ideonella livida]
MLRTALKRRRPAGFTLVELMVTLAVAALMLAMAVPAASQWVANARLRAVAETAQNAVRLAQAEAVRRSRSAGYLLTADVPSTSAVPQADGGRWAVLLMVRDGEASVDDPFLRGGTEAASQGVTVTGPALLCFNALGQRSTLTAAENGLGADCESPSGSDPVTYTFTASGASRSLAVQVGLGGEVRLCDPSQSLASGQVEGCR